MSKYRKNEALILVLALLMTGGVLGGVYLWTSEPEKTTKKILSPGNQILLSELTSKVKQAGVNAFETENYQLAVQQFEATLRQQKNDPETLIYLNNAIIGNQESYQIAVAAPASTVPNIALELLRGVAQAQTEINQAGGIDGVPLKVWIADDEGDSDSAKTIAETLSENQDILGVVGHYSSDSTLAAGVVYNQNQLVVISPTSTSTKISNMGDFVFRTVPSDRFAAYALARYFIQDLRLSRAAIFYNEQSAYSRSLKDELETTIVHGHGGEVVEIFDISLENFNPFRAYDSLIEKQADAIILVPNSGTLDKALQVVQVNENILPILAGDDVYQTDTLEVGEDAVGMLVAIPWHIQANRDSEFVETADELWGADVNWRTAMAYDATQTLAAAIAASPSREGVEQVLSTSGFSTQGATGTVRFLPSGDRNQAFELVTIQPGRIAGCGYDFCFITVALSDD